MLEGDLLAADMSQQGLGTCHLLLGTMLQLRMDISAVSPRLLFVMGTVGQSDIEGGV